MDRHGISIPKIEKQLINEIFRTCRLCGAGTGYKMLTIQKVVCLKHKIRECVQIEVHQDDKMSPIICELCFNKVNDFFEFLEMCRKTNKQTRLLLGLSLMPKKNLKRKEKEEKESSGEQPRLLGRRVLCSPPRSPPRILRGIKRTHADNVSLNRKQLMPKKDFKRKEKEGQSSGKQPRLLVRRVRCPPPRSPPRILRGTKRTHADDVSLNRKQLMPKKDFKRKEKEGQSSGKQPRLLVRRVRCPPPRSPPRILRGTKRTHADNVSLNRKQLMPKKDFKRKEKEGESSGKQPRLLGRRVPCPPQRSPPRILRGTKRTHADDVSLNRKQSEKPMEITGLREKEIDNKATSQKVDKPVERGPTPPPKKKVKKPKCRVCGVQDMCNIHQCSDRTAPIDPELLKQCRPLRVKISKCDVDYSEKRMEKEIENKANSQRVVNRRNESKKQGCAKKELKMKPTAKKLSKNLWGEKIINKIVNKTVKCLTFKH